MLVALQESMSWWRIGANFHNVFYLLQMQARWTIAFIVTQLHANSWLSDCSVLLISDDHFVRNWMRVNKKSLQILLMLENICEMGFRICPECNMQLHLPCSKATNMTCFHDFKAERWHVCTGNSIIAAHVIRSTHWTLGHEDRKAFLNGRYYF